MGYQANTLTKNQAAMNIKIVPREEIKMSKKDSSEYKPLLDALLRLEPGGDALEVSFESDSKLNSMRNFVYAYNRQTGREIKSCKHPNQNRVYFYEE